MLITLYSPCKVLRTVGNDSSGERDGTEGTGGRLISLDSVKGTLLPNSPYQCHGLPSSQHPDLDCSSSWFSSLEDLLRKKASLKKSCLKGAGKGDLADGPLKRKPHSRREMAIEASYQEGLCCLSQSLVLVHIINFCRSKKR